MVKNLTEAVDRLTVAVDRVVSLPPPDGGVPQADVDAEAGRVLQQAQRLEALPGPSNGETLQPGATARHK